MKRNFILAKSRTLISVDFVFLLVLNLSILYMLRQ